MESPAIISPTIQEWRGVRYYRSGRYFSRRGYGLIHRKVWADVYGPIPENHHIHHRDGDRANNAPENLEAIVANEHLAMHGASPTARQRAARSQNQQIAQAARLALPPVPIVCAKCGQPGEVPHGQRRRRNFCSPKCRERFHEDARYPKRHPLRVVTCAGCDATFETRRKGKRFCGDPACYYRAAKRTSAGV